MKELTARKNIRLGNHDYSQNGTYFLTICVKDKHEMLRRIVNHKSVLNEYGYIVKQEIEKIASIRKECVVDKYVIMPNHIHLIVQIVGDDGNRPVDKYADEICKRADYHPPLRKAIPNMVQGFKGAVSRRIGFSMWQRSFHDHIIRNEADYQRIWAYIDENPARWTEDCYYSP